MTIYRVFSTVWRMAHPWKDIWDEAKRAIRSMNEPFATFVDRAIIQGLASMPAYEGIRLSQQREVREAELARYGGLEGYPVLQALTQSDTINELHAQSPYSTFSHPLVNDRLFRIVNALVPRDKGAYAFDGLHDETVIVVPVPLRGTAGYLFRHRESRRSVILINEYYLLLLDMASRFYFPQLLSFAHRITSSLEELGLVCDTSDPDKPWEEIQALKRQLYARCIGNKPLWEICCTHPLFSGMQGHIAMQISEPIGESSSKSVREAFDYWSTHSLTDSIYAYHCAAQRDYEDFVLAGLSHVLGHELMHIWADHAVNPSPPTEMGTMLGEQGSQLPFKTMAELDADQGIWRMQLSQLTWFRPFSEMAMMGGLFLDGLMHLGDDFICQMQLGRSLNNKEQWLRNAVLYQEVTQLIPVVSHYPTATERSGFHIGATSWAISSHYGSESFVWLIALSAGWGQVMPGVSGPLADMMRARERQIKTYHPFIGVSPTMRRLEQFNQLPLSTQTQINDLYETLFYGTAPTSHHYNQAMIGEAGEDAGDMYEDMLRRMKDMSDGGTF